MQYVLLVCTQNKVYYLLTVVLQVEPVVARIAAEPWAAHQVMEDCLWDACKAAAKPEGLGDMPEMVV